MSEQLPYTLERDEIPYDKVTNKSIFPLAVKLREEVSVLLCSYNVQPTRIIFNISEWTGMVTLEVTQAEMTRITARRPVPVNKDGLASIWYHDCVITAKVDNSRLLCLLDDTQARF